MLEDSMTSHENALYWSNFTSEGFCLSSNFHRACLPWTWRHIKTPSLPGPPWACCHLMLSSGHMILPADHMTIHSHSLQMCLVPCSLSIRAGQWFSRLQCAPRLREGYRHHQAGCWMWQCAKHKDREKTFKAGRKKNTATGPKPLFRRNWTKIVSPVFLLSYWRN